MAKAKTNKTTATKKETSAAKAAPKTEATKPEPKKEIAVENKKEYGNTNPANIVWPTDPWGMTRALRKEITRLGQRTGGAADKRKVATDTLQVGLKFLADKYEFERDLLEGKLAEIRNADGQLELDV